LWPAFATGIELTVEIVTLDGVESRAPSFDNQLRDIGAWLIGHEGRRGRGWIVEGRSAAAGLDVIDQRNVSGSPFASLDALPSRCTIAPPQRLRVAGPAHGSLVPVPIVTVSGALSTVPSSRSVAQ
jgi:hypothetical protein